MFWRRDQPAFDRIMVHVFQLLQHDLIAQDRLRMRAFLPDLMLALGLVQPALKAQLAEEPIAMFGFELFEDTPRSMAL